jgi:alpha,alpha-trehalase
MTQAREWTAKAWWATRSASGSRTDAPAAGSVRRGLRRALAAGLALLLLGSAATAAAPAPPSALFGELFRRVQSEAIFPDDKTFADAVSRRSPAEILADYRARTPRDGVALKAFVAANVDLPSPVAVPAAAADRAPLKAHIARLWPKLARPPSRPAPYSSMLALPRPYVVPGGRFREVYYWDSYFTMLGLVRDGRGELVRDLTADFASLIARYGHVPNGARSYYLSRSQPPVFYLMAELSARTPAEGDARWLRALRTEHRFWMKGEAEARPGAPAGHVVRMADGAVLNRYWDALAVPRDEAFRLDVALAAHAGRPAAGLYRDLRSAAESGWDFSSRWLADGRDLATIRTTEIVPVDLNSLLYGLEQAIARGCARKGEPACAKAFRARAERRRAAITRYLWDAPGRRFLDYDWRIGTRLDRPSAAMLYPLFVGLASQAQADGVAMAVRSELLAPGGLRTTTRRTGQQWDAPNGWAPLQWIAVQGLAAYGRRDLSDEIAGRWVRTVCRAYGETGKLVEKYDVEDVRPGGGGEYPLQDGFGWTNGVTRALMGAPRYLSCRASPPRGPPRS